jgi:hypothetical protein
LEITAWITQNISAGYRRCKPDRSLRSTKLSQLAHHRLCQLVGIFIGRIAIILSSFSGISSKFDEILQSISLFQLHRNSTNEDYKRLA